MIGDKGGNCWQRLPIKARHCQPPRSSTSFCLLFPFSSFPLSPPSSLIPVLSIFSFCSFLSRLLFLTSSIHLSFYRGLSLPFNLHLPHDYHPSFLPSFLLSSDFHGEILILRGAITRGTLINDSCLLSSLPDLRPSAVFFDNVPPSRLLLRYVSLNRPCFYYFEFLL